MYFNVAYNRNGSQLATISKDKKIRIFDPRINDSITEISSMMVLKNHPSFGLII